VTRVLLLLAALLAAPAAAQENDGSTAVATFASGCFWCTEADFAKVPGVIDVVSGYTGGTVPDPTYQQVSAGGTGYTEAVEVRYDSGIVSYERLLDVYWRNVDFLDGGGQFCDRGDQYRPAIFVHDEAQRAAAERTKAELERSGRFDRPIAVQIDAAAPFYPAEDYHQDYAEKNPIRYRFYRYNCGRDARLAELWQGS
jgi:peptide-methionine (S)-S-oxide reductase